MRQQDNGQEELQVKFTGYLIQAVRRTRRDYLLALYRHSNREIPTDTIYAESHSLEQDAIEQLSLWDMIEDDVLLHALKQLNKRERYVFLTRVLDNCSFDILGTQLGLSYKGVASIYYRAIQKLKRNIKEVSKP